MAPKKSKAIEIEGKETYGGRSMSQFWTSYGTNQGSTSLVAEVLW